MLKKERIITIVGFVFLFFVLLVVLSSMASAGLVLLDTQYDGDSFSYGIWGDGTYIYDSGEGGMYAYTFDENGTGEFWLKDVTNEDLCDVWGDGTYIYTSCGIHGIRAYTFNENGTEEFWLKDTQDDGRIGDVWGDGTYIYVVNNDQGLLAYTFNGSSFTLKGSIVDANWHQNQYIWGDGTYIYAGCWWDGIHAYTFDGANFVLKDTQDNGEYYYGVWYNDGYIYVAHDEWTLSVYTFDGTTLVRVDSLYDGNYGMRVHGDETYLYVTCCCEGIRAISFDGTDLTLLETRNDGDGGVANYRGVWCQDGYIFTTVYDAGIFAYEYCDTYPVVYVDDDASAFWYDCNHVDTITLGLERVQENGVIYVWDGTYAENVDVDKSVDIIGNGSSNVKAQGIGMSTDGVFNISVNHVNISNLGITNGTKSVYINANYTNLTSCYINNSTNGISIEINKHYNLVYNNTIINNTVGINISINCENNTIYNNHFNNTDNFEGYGEQIWNVSKIFGTNIIGGPYLGGNYWSDYTGVDTDGDGLGNTLIPYNASGDIPVGFGDYLPLANPASNNCIIAGYITDNDGNFISGATVIVKNNATGITNTTTSNVDGLYDCSLLANDGVLILGNATYNSMYGTNNTNVDASLFVQWLNITISTTGTINADFSYTPNNPVVSEPIYFQDRSTGTGIIYYHWNFRDGTTGNGRTIYHSFDEPGDYQVKLEIYDGTNRDSIERTIRVTLAGDNYEWSIVDPMPPRYPRNPYTVPEMFRLLRIDQVPYSNEKITIVFLDSGYTPRTYEGYDLASITPLKHTVYSTYVDKNGHGTWVSYPFVYLKNLTLGNMEIISFKVFDKNGGCSIEVLLESLDMIKTIDPDILSFSGGAFAVIDNPVSRKFKELNDQGIIVIAAAGNSGPAPGTILSPASSDFVLGVGATDPMRTILERIDDIVCSWSGRGPVPDISPKPDYSSPGESILGPWLNGETVKSGTSMSTPFIACGSATIYANNKGLVDIVDLLYFWSGDTKPRMVEESIANTCFDKGDPNSYGHGIPDFEQANGALFWLCVFYLIIWIVIFVILPIIIVVWYKYFYKKDKKKKLVFN